MKETELREKALNGKRLANMYNDLAYLERQGYTIIDMSEDMLNITIKGFLFSYKQINAIYIYAKKDDEFKNVLHLQY